MNQSEQKIFDLVMKEDYEHLPLKTPDEIFRYVDNSLIPNWNFDRKYSREFHTVLLRLFERAAQIKFTDAVVEYWRKKSSII
jgi:hypothetical protein